MTRIVGVDFYQRRTLTAELVVVQTVAPIGSVNYLYSTLASAAFTRATGLVYTAVSVGLAELLVTAKPFVNYNLFDPRDLLSAQSLDQMTMTVAVTIKQGLPFSTYLSTALGRVTSREYAGDLYCSWRCLTNNANVSYDVIGSHYYEVDDGVGDPLSL